MEEKSLRDEIALLAMRENIRFAYSRPDYFKKRAEGKGVKITELVAVMSYEIADEMLKAREHTT